MVGRPVGSSDRRSIRKTDRTRTFLRTLSGRLAAAEFTSIRRRRSAEAHLHGAGAGQFSGYTLVRSGRITKDSTRWSRHWTWSCQGILKPTGDASHGVQTRTMKLDPIQQQLPNPSRSRLQEKRQRRADSATAGSSPPQDPAAGCCSARRETQTRSGDGRELAPPDGPGFVKAGVSSGQADAR